MLVVEDPPRIDDVWTPKPGDQIAADLQKGALNRGDTDVPGAEVL